MTRRNGIITIPTDSPTQGMMPLRGHAPPRGDAYLGGGQGGVVSVGDAVADDVGGGDVGDGVVGVDDADACEVALVDAVDVQFLERREAWGWVSRGKTEVGRWVMAHLEDGVSRRVRRESTEYERSLDHAIPTYPFPSSEIELKSPKHPSKVPLYTSPPQARKKNPLPWEKLGGSPKGKSVTKGP